MMMIWRPSIGFEGCVCDYCKPSYDTRFMHKTWNNSSII